LQLVVVVVVAVAAAAAVVLYGVTVGCLVVTGVQSVVCLCVS